MSSAIDPKQAYAKAQQLHQQGQLAEAMSIYQALDADYPNHPDIQHNLGLLAYQTGDHLSAEILIKKANNLKQNNIYLANLGLVYKEMRAFDKALLCFEQALVNAKQPEIIYNNMALCLLEKGDLSLAKAQIDKALAIAPNFAEAHHSTGLIALSSACSTSTIQQKKHTSKPNDMLSLAEKHFKTALDLKPNYAEPHNSLGKLMRQQNNLPAAKENYLQALAIKPDYVDALGNLANYYADAHEFALAKQYYQNALALVPKHADIHMNYAALLLSLEEYQTGWQHYEYRLQKLSHTQTHPSYPFPLLDEQDITSKTLLLSTEQGLGDNLLFAQFIKAVLAKASTCYLDCEARLFDIFKQAFPKINIIKRQDNFDWQQYAEIDYYCPLGSLPKYLSSYDAKLFQPLAQSPDSEHTNIKAKQYSANFMNLDKDKVVRLREKYLKLSKQQPLIGIAWRSDNPSLGSRRSIALERLLSSLNKQGLNLYISLQYGDCKNDIAKLTKKDKNTLYVDEAINSQDDLTNFAEQVAVLDLVISIDNTTVHFAGALDIPCFILLSKGIEWRWPVQRDTCAWYAKTKLFRQEVYGDWDQPLLALEQAVKDFLCSNQTMDSP